MPVPKRIIVTGAARGIGLAIAGHLLKSGCQVLLIDRNTERLASAVAALEAAHHGRVFSHCMDLSDSRAILEGLSVHPWCEEGLDGLVNNAAVELLERFEEFSMKQMDATWKVNMLAPMLVTRVCLQALAKSKGSVVNISSVASRRPHPYYSIYAASKAFLEAFTRQLATEVGPKGIRVNVVSPGGIQTELMDEICAARGFSPEKIKEYTNRIPMEQRWASPEEIAEVVAFALFGPRYLHGEILHVDGAVYI